MSSQGDQQLNSRSGPGQVLNDKSSPMMFPNLDSNALGIPSSQQFSHIQQQPFQMQRPVPKLTNKQIMGQSTQSELNNFLASTGQSQMQTRAPHSRGSQRSERGQLNKSQFDSKLSILSSTTQQSVIPGKTQRILINKKQPFSASAAASRCFNRAGSQNKLSKSSVFGASSLSTQSSFSSFAKAASTSHKEQ